MGISKKIEVISVGGYPKNKYTSKGSVTIWLHNGMDVSLTVKEAVKFAKELTTAIENAAGIKKDGE
jgi:hypothetical protein